MDNTKNIPTIVRIARRLSWQQRIEHGKRYGFPRTKIWGGRPRPKRYGGENRGSE